MNFCRRVTRHLFFERKKADKRNFKELIKGCVHNLFTNSLQKIILSAAGITMLAQPLFAGSSSSITNLGSQTKIDYDEGTKTHTITTDKVIGKNAFNAFKTFTLSSNEIANLKFPDNTENLLNFVKSNIDIQGTLNAVKNNRIGGNLYFLSSEGLILGKGGVINAGAFYAMTPTKGFMDKFIGKDNKLNLSRVDNEIEYITSRTISNYNERYDYGVTINPYGEITIEGKINTINGIGLYAGGRGEVEENGKKVTKNGLKIANTAVLNTLDKNDLSSFVNLKGIDLPQATDIVADEGGIELVSVQDNTHQDSKIFEYLSGYTSFSTADAFAKIESDGVINSRNNVDVTAYASNGHVSWIKTDDSGEIIRSEFEQVANIASVSSLVSIGVVSLFSSTTVFSIGIIDLINSFKALSACS